jgi:cell division protein FtsW
MNRRALDPDYLLLIITFMLVAVGVFMVYDASFAWALKAKSASGDGFFYMKRQAVAAVIGLPIMLMISRISYWKFRMWSKLAMFGSIVMLALVFVPHFGVSFAHAHRWIKFPGFGVLQCSEVAKIGLILYLAHIGAKRKYRIRKWGDLASRLGVILLFAAMVAVEPDLGTALVLIVIGVSILIASGMRGTHLAVIIVGLIGVLALAILMEPYRISRIMAFRDPWKYYHQSGYQIVQSLIALGSGGVWGVGLARGTQKFFYLPAGHTDYIFATIGEELGLAGTLVILTLYFIFTYCGMKIANRTKDPFGMLVAVGISAMVGAQAILNIAVVSSSVPSTGVPLPFISYGGSSLILTLVSVGVLLNISKHPDSNEPVEMRKAKDENNFIGGRNRRTYLSGFERG